MADVEVRHQATPNPNAGKFTVVGHRMVEGDASRSYHTPEQASSSPVAAALFELDGVASVFMVEDFVTVTKTPDADWSELVPAVTDTIRRAMSGDGS